MDKLWTYYVENEYYREVVIEDSQPENQLYLFEFFDGLSWEHKYATVFRDNIMSVSQNYGVCDDAFYMISDTLKIISESK